MWGMHRESTRMHRWLAWHCVDGCNVMPDYFLPTICRGGAAVVSGVPPTLIIGGLHLPDFLGEFNISCHSWKPAANVSYG